MIVNGGEISELMMETIGLRLWEMLQLTIAGVKTGVMHTNALVIDTDVANISATGSIELGQETLDLTVTSEPKKTSPLSLRGAIALSIVNPLLALFALVETEPGLDSDCGQLIREAKEPAPKVPGKKTLAFAPAPQ